MSLGTVVVGGHTYTITSLHLRNGRLEITAIKHGPVPAMENEPAAVFGEDGQGILQGPADPSASITCREVEPHETGKVTLNLRWDVVTAE